MSAETVARWNAIPMSRQDPEQDPRSFAKRARSDDGMDQEDNESEDNISLMSRSASPTPAPDAMDIEKYDEYVQHKAAHEAVTVDTKIKSTNKGFLMLAKMGWTEGRPVGLSSDGRVDPVPFYVKNDLTGLGKASQDVRMIESTVAQRRELDSERMTKETEEQRKARESEVAKKAAVQSEIASTLRAFYCELCEKQFQNVAQYDEHTNSYAHHHKARFRDMQAAQRASRNTEEALRQRKEKERKREEKELRKQAKAAGIKLAKPPATVVVSPLTGAIPTPADAAQLSGSKKSGWATVSSSSLPASEPAAPMTESSGIEKAGWATVDAPASSSRQERPAEAAVGGVPASLPGREHEPPAQQRHSPSSAPAFRTGGWTSLDTGSSVPTPHSSAPSRPPPPPSTGLPPSLPAHIPVPSSVSLPPAAGAVPVPFQEPATASYVRPGWSQVSRPVAQSSASASQDASRDAQPGIPAPRPLIPDNAVQKAQPTVARKESSRSGWQQFKASGPGRRR